MVKVRQVSWEQGVGLAAMEALLELPICSACGADLKHDRPISLGGLYYDPRSDIYWHGEMLSLTVGERVVLGTLVKDAGRCVPVAALDERIGHEGDSNVVQALICRLRSKLGQIAPAPIETQRGVGYRWAA